MKCLVTGGAGFIGSHLVESLLGMGHEVVVLDILRHGNKLRRPVLRSVEMLIGDVRDEDCVLSAARGCDLIFHFAAIVGVDDVSAGHIDAMETEVFSMRHLAKAAGTHGIEKIIYASTSGVYGKVAVDQAVKEDVAVSPKSSYAVAKRYNEIYLSSLLQERQIETVALRFFNVYGPRQDARMVIPRFFAQAMSGKPLTVYAPGDQTRDFTYVDDVTEAIMRLTSCMRGSEIYNISLENELTILDLASKVVEVCDSDSQIIMVDMPEKRMDQEVERRFGCSDKLHAVTGYRPNTKLEEGLRRIHELLLDSKVDVGAVASRSLWA